MAQFDRPWYEQHGFGQVCHVSGYGSQPRLPGAAKTDIPRASGLNSQGNNQNLLMTHQMFANSKKCNISVKGKALTEGAHQTRDDLTVANAAYS